MSWLHTHFILPWTAPERHAGLAGRMRTIQRFERMPEAAQREEQQRRLRRVLQHAYDTVPYYRRQFDDAGFSPSTARLDRPLPLPTLKRDQLRDGGTALLSSAFKQEDLRTSSSGGTTSTPVTFYRDMEGLRNKTALALHLNAMAGFHPGDPVMMLWGSHRDLALNPSWRWRLYDEVIMRRISAPSGVLSDEVMERFRVRYEESRPKVLYCYATVLAAFAAHLKERGFRHRPKVMIATAELLSDADRALIESVFGIPVYDFYGSRDISMIASECSAHTGVHFHPWGSYVEFDPIGDTPDGPAYRLLVTDLLNYGQPFIRYDTGDCVTLATDRCGCGRWFPRAEKILGRMGDGILLPDGSMVPAVSMGNCVSLVGHSFQTIAQIQFIQKFQGHVLLRYVTKDNSSSPDQELNTIRNAIDSMTNQPMHWTTERVAEIPRERSGKIRLCISEVRPSAAEPARIPA